MQYVTCESIKLHLGILFERVVTFLHMQKQTNI